MVKLPEYSINSKFSKCAPIHCLFSPLKNSEKMYFGYYTWSTHMPYMVPEMGNMWRQEILPVCEITSQICKAMVVTLLQIPSV